MPPRDRKRKVCSCCEVAPSVVTSSKPQHVRKRRRVQLPKPVPKVVDPVVGQPNHESSSKSTSAVVSAVAKADSTNTALTTSPPPPATTPGAATTTTVTYPESANNNSLILSEVFACGKEVDEEIVFVSAGHSTRRIRRRACRTIRGLDAVHTFTKEVTYTFTSRAVGYIGQELVPFRARPDFCGVTSECSQGTGMSSARTVSSERTVPSADDEQQVHSSKKSASEPEVVSAHDTHENIKEPATEVRAQTLKNVFTLDSDSSDDDSDDNVNVPKVHVGSYGKFDIRKECVSESGDKCKKHEEAKQKRCTCNGWPPCAKRAVPKPCPREMEELLEAYWTDNTDYEGNNIIQDVNTGSNGCNPCIYLYNEELLTLCNRQQNNLRVYRTFNLGPCFVTGFVFRNSNLVYNKPSVAGQTYGPLMIGPVMLHFDKAPETYTRFFETIRDRVGIAKTDMTEAEIKDKQGVQSKDYKITRLLRRVFGSNMGLAGIHHVPIHLHVDLRRSVSCYSRVSRVIDGVYEKYCGQRKETRLVLEGRSEIWSLHPRTGTYLQTRGSSSTEDKLRALDNLSLECW